jgi:sulfofructose kinase
MAGPLVICVGHAALDHVFEVDAFPAHPTKTQARRYGVFGGGMAANAAVAAARLGARVRFVGAVGDDLAGRLIRDKLVLEGIDVSALQRVVGGVTSVSAVIVDAKGERQVYNHRGDALALATPPTPHVFDSADAVLADPRWPVAAAMALQWARDHALPSVFDGDVAPGADLRSLAALAAWAVFSEPGLAAFAPGQSVDGALHEAVSSGASVSAVTQGERGVCWMRGDGLQHLGAFDVSSVDSTGAGDVFHGALAVAVAEGRDDVQALRFASAAAALKCRKPGGVLGAPTRSELDSFLQGYSS